MAKNPFKGLKLANKAQAKILRRDTAADFRWAQGGLDSVTANLLTSQTGLGRTLTRQNARTVAGMQRVSRKSAQSIARTVEGGQDRVSNAYGNVIGGDPNLFALAKATAKGSKVANKAAVAGGKLQSKAGNQALDILKQAGKTAGKAANYELATALRERQSADAAVIAQAKVDLASQRLDSRMQERYLQLQNGGGEGYASAAAALNGGLLDGSITPADAAEWARRFALQYNLGPSEKQKLMRLAEAGGGGSTESNSTPYGLDYRNQYGYSPSSLIPDDVEQEMNLQVQKMYDPKKPVPGTGEALKLAGITIGPDGKATGPNGAELSEEFVAAAVAYVQSTWYRIKNQLQGGAPTPTTRTAATSTAALPATAAPAPDRNVGGNAYGPDGYAVPAAGTGAGSPAPADGSAVGTTKSGQQYIYKGGNPYYLQSGYVVPANDLP